MKAKRSIIMGDHDVNQILKRNTESFRIPIQLDSLKPSETSGYDWDFRKDSCWNSVINENLIKKYCPYYAKKLWVKEAFAGVIVDDYYGIVYRSTKDVKFVNFLHYPKINFDQSLDGNIKWVSAGSMRESLSRILLEVEDVYIDKHGDKYYWIIDFIKT